MKDKERVNGGLKTVRLRAGSEGRAKVTLLGRGPYLFDVDLPIAPPIQLQFRNRDSGLCFTAVYDAADIRLNDTTRGKFKASTSAPSF